MSTPSRSPVVRFRDVGKVYDDEGLELELTAFAFVDLLDGSVLSQISANYYLSHQWTASTYLSSNLGAARSERGSFAQRFSTIFQLTLYL